MQAIQHQGMNMRDHQFFNQGNEKQNNNTNGNIAIGIPNNGFGSQMNTNGLMNQPQQLQQQPGNLPTLHGFNQPQEQGNAYLMNQKGGPLLPQQQDFQGMKAPVQQQQQQQSQPFNNNTNLGVPGPIPNNLPPGLNVMQQPGVNVSVNRPVNMPLAPNMNAPPGANTVSNSNMMPPMILPPLMHLFVREVWKTNLHSEFVAIRRLATQYNYVSVSTEFIGTLARPIGNFSSKEDYHYQTMRSNVDILNPVQLGISLSDANGNKPDNEPSTWQFNFDFDTNKEMISAESLELLRNSGINFENHRTTGIDKFEFAQLMMDSGLILDTNTAWITFHAAYDLGFLVHILTNDMMPSTRADFEWWVHKFMPNLFDLNLIYKMIRDFKNPQHAQSQGQPPKYSLTTVGDEIGIPRFPIFTTTGGQALLMLLSFCYLSKLSMHKLPDGTDFAQYKNVIYGINEDQLQQAK
ncbi:similar to Saccharomyces cerevisiae YNR052C POP2 RNase of the DEDD superfamily, subunit of the Ccr4-Not complex that mediates 3' to 5' mRNA deadenylation [Maudiozyma barnettii]|uniref:poly(A)-specific ribonuclease n=1 Tax=Maudiozyma barnettii TaxID=61262 RepID=A0A8H2VH26_9SACH|nr:similar to Saccharomyces cerevisiae YNR052C POP2 RNase of the DEDD superfamily, subunit of the Ccr4-Not complex that mediates 3' to 5' mRNA deadenylation [Kazachstania barnettii]CAB4255440.1 similar to Saccharomyces cerevisiae YNR052C POP2 RNase of the DEDD superfamily, subunit of the Ccr4-Not complex that mediates 3' to 5' mRNA deadenylation [Kazachstania barnettii]CAD1783883.1 similar to Saccharomyces cerevisiae YNR052C POP2 RNase of the DEDD superfamily, subunit of the Ccr4-Not complex that